MNNTASLIQSRTKQLETLISKKKAALKNAPQGHLRICRKPSSYKMYYHIREEGDSNGKYIRKKDRELARRLAQKDYDLAVLQAAEKEAEVLTRALLLLPETTAEEIYESLSASRQEFITPVRLTDSQFVQEWLSEPYEKKPVSEDTPEFITDQGERVRSKSELIIANMLYHMRIPYKYECPLILDGNRVIYPDFTALNVAQRKVYYLEHLGMMDDPEYCNDALERIRMYQRNDIFPGDSLILTHETGRHPLNVRNVEKLVKHFLL